MSETPNPIATISRAGGMTGPTSDPAWHHLVWTNGESNVCDLVKFLYQKCRQPVTVADARREFEERERILDDESESDGLPLPRPPTTPPPPAPARSAPVELPPAKLDDRTINETRVAVIARMELRKISRVAAAEEIGISPGMFGQFFRYEPVPPTLVTAYTDPQDQPMTPPAPHPLIAQMMNEIKARKITILVASQQIGINESATYKARTTGRLTPIMEQKVAKWIAPAPALIEKKPEITFEKAVFKKADGDEPTKLTPRQMHQVDYMTDPSINRTHNDVPVSGFRSSRADVSAYPHLDVDGIAAQMKALAIAMSCPGCFLTNENPRSSAVLARMYASLAERQAALSEKQAHKESHPTATTAPTWKGGAL